MGNSIEPVIPSTYFESRNFVYKPEELSIRAVTISEPKVKLLLCRRTKHEDIWCREGGGLYNVPLYIYWISVVEVRELS
jgi:hypothetical protein